MFDRFPGLRVILSGFGAAWLPSVLWRLDEFHRAGRLNGSPRSPSEIVAEHVRFTTRHLDAPGLEQLLGILPEGIGGVAAAP